MMDEISQLFMMDEISHGEITEVEDVSVPAQLFMMDEISHGEITEVEAVSVPLMDEISQFYMMDEISHGESTEVEDVSIPETSEVVDTRSTDWIHTLNRLNEVLEALHDEKSKEAAGGSDVHPMPASDVTIGPCSCHIDSAVQKEWKRSINLPWVNRMKLMELLKKYPCLLAIHGRSGDTVLHAAAREGNLKLLVYTCSLFLNDRGNAVKEYVHGDNKIDRKAFFNKENEGQFTAKDCLQFTMGGTTMYAYFDNFVKFGRFDTWNDWNATLAAMQDEVFEPFYDDKHPVKKRLADYKNGIYKDNGGVVAKSKMKEIIINEYNDRKEQLDCYATPTGSELIAEYEELHFLLTLSGSNIKAVEEEYLRAVIRGCVEEGPDVVKYLFRHRNVKGQTAFHCANVRYWEMLSEEIPEGEEYKDCFNARDVRGWTVLHCAVVEGKGVGASAQGKEGGAIAIGQEVECLVKDTRVDVNVKMPKENSSKGKRNGVALHLAIIYDRVEVVRKLLQRKDINVNAIYIKDIISIGCDFRDANWGHWTPLQLAVLLMRHEIIIELLNHPKVIDLGVQKRKFLWSIGVQLCQNANEETSKPNQKPSSTLSAIHLAGIIGDPQTLRCFLNISKFDLSVTIQGFSALHFVLNPTPLKSEELLRKSHFYDEREYEKYFTACKDMQKSLSNKDREACISILIQGGLDVWRKDDDNKFTQPGPHTSRDVRYFWQQMLLSETQDAKNNLNNMGNAVSVVSALVATASYVGPLQPPLGLESNFVQDESLFIRIYMVTNTISFYMAVASIIFAVVLSLPVPQEGLYEEWQRSQKTIIIAIHLLLGAVLNILVSFGAASNVVVSSEYSWQHKGLVFYPTLLGGSLCLIAIILFYLRLLRLSYVKNLTIKRIYHSVCRATQKEDGGEGGKYEE